MSSPESLRQALNHLDAMPAIPWIAQKILKLKLTTDEGERELLELIEKDPIILSRVVGLANSPLSGASRKILTPKDAMALLGSKRVKMVALSFAMMSSMPKKNAGLLNVQGLWQHSLCVAMTMDTLAHFMPKERRPPEDEIYLAGLLHDIGYLVLNYLDSGLCDKFVARIAAEPGRQVGEIEAEVLEIGHGKLGEALGRHWNLPESITAAMNCHHLPANERANGQLLVAMVILAERLLPAFGVPESVRNEVGAEDWRELGIEVAAVGEVMAEIEKNVSAVAAMFTPGTNSL